MTVKNAFDQIEKKLKNHNIIVKFRATDGDVGFDSMHDEFFYQKQN